MCATTDLELDASAQDRRREILHRMRMLRKQPEEPPPDQEVHVDVLAVVTAHQRRLVEAVYKKLDDFTRRNNVLGVLFRSTQPAHLVMVLAVLIISSTVGQSSLSTTPPSTLTNLAYLGSFSIHVGNQFWMTFVSGLALYFNLPRHDFGAVQKILFPKYFTINSFLCLVTLLSFTKLQHSTTLTTPEMIQVAALSLCFLLQLTIRLYVVPPVIRLITEKTQLEIAAGVGREVGHFSPGTLLSCPYYKRKHLTFRRLHILVAVGNIVAMACNSLHLYYLTQHWTCHVA